jgi:Protein of unknown function (DUF2637)
MHWEYLVNGKRWATGAFLVGIAMSIYGNVAHVVIKTTSFGAIAFASFWPVAVFLSIEVMARVEWPTGWKWAVARFGGLGLVAAVAAITSYTHLSALLTYYGESGVVATIGPLAVDGLMVVAAAALQAVSQNQRAETATETRTEAAEDDGVADTTPHVLEAPDASGAPAARRWQRRGKLAKLSAAERNRQAEEAYAASLDTDAPLTYQEIAEQYGDGRGERWARDRQKAVRQARQDQAA